MSRLPEEPLPAQVELDARGDPKIMRLETSQGRSVQPVLEVCARWRVDDDWWRVPVSRMYYKVRTRTTLLELFRDLNTGEWFLERVHD